MGTKKQPKRPWEYVHVKSAWLEPGSGERAVIRQRRNANVKPKDEGTIKYDYVNM